MADQNYSPHFLYRFGGAYGSEEWSCGLRMRITPYGDDADQVDKVATSFLDAQDEALSTFGNAIKTFMQQRVDISWSSMNHISRTGKYTSPNSHTRTLGTAIAGTGSTASWTGPDTAVAVTFLTEVQRGYASKGRIYLPLSVFALDGSAGPAWGTISPANRTTIANATATFLSTLNNLGTEMAASNPSVLGASCTVAVFSPGTGQKQNPNVPGAYHPVRWVRVGGQLDVQQRRLNKVDDLWLSTSSSVSVAP